MSKIEELKNTIGRNGKVDELVNVNSVEYKLAQKDKTIADLEAKLALYDEVIKEREDDLETLFLIRDNLEQQLAESKKPKEIRFNGFVIDCNYDEARENLQKEILKMQEENNELRKSQELQTYAQNILEIKELKQQLAEKEKEIEELKASNVAKDICLKIVNGKTKIEFATQQLQRVKDNILDIGNGYWRYFMKNGKQYMTSDDLESCLNETIDQIIAEIKQEGK